MYEQPTELAHVIAPSLVRIRDTATSITAGTTTESGGIFA
jgi:hypothetical protein